MQLGKELYSILEALRGELGKFASPAPPHREMISSGESGQPSRVDVQIKSARKETAGMLRRGRQAANTARNEPARRDAVLLQRQPPIVAGVLSACSARCR